MSGADVLASGTVSRSAARAARPWEAARRLSRRTSLRTKLITAVLVLVAIAVAAISLASTYMVRAYLIDQHDSELLAQVSAVNFSHNLPQGVDRRLRVPDALGHRRGAAAAGQPAQPGTPAMPLPFMSNNDPLPQLPTSSNWASASKGVTLNLPAQSGPNTWRVMAESVTGQQRDHRRERPRPPSSSPWTSATSTR